MRTPKVRPHNHLIKLLYDGELHSPDEVLGYFKDSGLDRSYLTITRIPMLIWQARQDGAQIRTMKEGREVIAYQLLNPNLFDGNSGLAWEYVNTIRSKNLERAKIASAKRERLRGQVLKLEEKLQQLGAVAVENGDEEAEVQLVTTPPRQRRQPQPPVAVAPQPRARGQQPVSEFREAPKRGRKPATPPPPAVQQPAARASGFADKLRQYGGALPIPAAKAPEKAPEPPKKEAPKRFVAHGRQPANDDVQLIVGGKRPQPEGLRKANEARKAAAEAKAQPKPKPTGRQRKNPFATPAEEQPQKRAAAGRKPAQTSPKIVPEGPMGETEAQRRERELEEFERMHSSKKD